MSFIEATTQYCRNGSTGLAVQCCDWWSQVDGNKIGVYNFLLKRYRVVLLCSDVIGWNATLVKPLCKTDDFGSWYVHTICTGILCNGATMT